VEKIGLTGGRWGDGLAEEEGRAPGSPEAILPELPKGSRATGQRRSVVKSSSWLILDHGEVNGVNFPNFRSPQNLV
jgi:hypothetical protein